MKSTAGQGRSGLRLLLAVLAGAAAAGCEGDPGDQGGGSNAEGGGATLALAPGTWQALPPIPDTPRFYMGVAAARGRVFVVGGYRRPEEMVVVHAFDVASSTWETLPPLPFRIPMANAVAVKDRLFVLGGLDVDQTLEYDFDTRSWSNRAPVPVRGPGSASIGVHGDTVLLAGGILPGLSINNLGTGERLRDLLAYDTVTNTWEVLPEAPVAVGYAMGAVVRDELFVIGGSYAARTDEVLVFNVKSRQWSQGVHLPLAISSAAVGVIGNQIVVSGGIASTTGMISDQTFAFDPARPAAGWVTLAPLTTPRFATGGAVVDNRLYVPTGMGTGPGGPLDFRALPNFEVFIPGP